MMICTRKETKLRRSAKYQEALDGGHDVLVLVSEVWGGFSPEALAGRIADSGASVLSDMVGGVGEVGLGLRKRRSQRHAALSTPS